MRAGLPGNFRRSQGLSGRLSARTLNVGPVPLIRDGFRGAGAGTEDAALDLGCARKPGEP